MFNASWTLPTTPWTTSASPCLPPAREPFGEAAHDPVDDRIELSENSFDGQVEDEQPRDTRKVRSHLCQPESDLVRRGLALYDQVSQYRDVARLDEVEEIRRDVVTDEQEEEKENRNCR